MFSRNILLLTLCLSMPSALLANDPNALLDMSFVKKFLPSEYHSVAESQIGAIKAAVGAADSSTIAPAAPGQLAGLTGQVSTSTPLPSIPLPSNNLQYTPPQAPVSHNHAHSHSGSFNPYMPSAPAAPSAAAPSTPHTHYVTPAAAAAAAPALPAAPVQASAGPANPFLGGNVVQQAQPAPELILKADLNANPVFHPPQESTVPSYPPIEGQHWYQYVLVEQGLNPLN